MTNLQDLSFKFTVNADGTVTYVAGCDGKTQRLADRDTSDKEALRADLEQYTIAYVNGLREAQTDIGEDITVGKQETAVAQEA